MLGGGIYFAECPWCTYRKSLSGSNDVIIIALLKVGRFLTERWAHTYRNLQKVNEMGYDSVQMRHCKTGIEIWMFTFRIQKMIQRSDIHMKKIQLVLLDFQNEIYFIFITNYNCYVNVI